MWTCIELWTKSEIKYPSTTKIWTQTISGRLRAIFIAYISSIEFNNVVCTGNTPRMIKQGMTKVLTANERIYKTYFDNIFAVWI